MSLSRRRKILGACGKGEPFKANKIWSLALYFFIHYFQVLNPYAAISSCYCCGSMLSLLSCYGPYLSKILNCVSYEYFIHNFDSIMFICDFYITTCIF